MGGLFSSPFTSSPTPQDTKQILNTILREMFRRADLTDLYSLADPERCKGYLIVAADALDDMFGKINLYPKKGADGTFYFQKLEGIRQRHPRPEQQRQLCQQLAFFYIRIFQIYAALALSVMDSELPTADPQDIAAIQRADRTSAVFIDPRGLAGFPRPPKRTGFFTMRGGALSSQRDISFYLTPDAAGVYSILNKYLNRPSSSDPEAPLTFNEYAGMTIAQDQLYTREVGTRTVKPLSAPDNVPIVLCSIIHLDTSYTLSGKLLIKGLEPGKLTVQLTNITTLSSTSTKAVNSQQITLQQLPGDTEPKARIDDTEKTLPFVLFDMFKIAFEDLVGPTFSPAYFLNKFKLIRSYDAPSAIDGSRVVLTRSARSLEKQASLPIEYTDRLTIDKREREIKIVAQLNIERKGRNVVSNEQNYSVYIDYSNIRTTPEEIRSYLENPTKTQEVTFTTGLYDNAPPRSVERGFTIGQFIQGAFERLMKPLRERGVEAISRDKISYTREGYARPYNSQAIPADLRVKKMWEALLRTPPLKAHCVARAVQLLNVAAIKGVMSKEAFSSACRTRFPYIEDGSLPAADRAITSAPGIAALSQLFVDRVLGGAPKISSSPQVQVLGKRLKQFFEGFESLDAVGEGSGELEKIKSLRPDICKGRGDGIIDVTPSTAGKLREYARRLVSQQGGHLRRVMSLLFRLFREDKIRAGVFEIHPSVTMNGMDYLNKLAEEARTLLVQYYAGCEETYRAGLAALKAQSGPSGPTVRSEPERPRVLQPAARRVPFEDDDDDDPM